MKNRTLPICLLIGATLTTFPALTQPIHVFNWAHYLDQDVVASFEQQSGHSVIQDYFASEDLRSEVIDSGRGSGFDLILMDNWGLQIMGDKGMFHDISQLSPSLVENNNARSRHACGDYGIPYAEGTLGILYRASLTQKPIESWMDLLNPAPEHQGKIAMYPDIVDGMAAPLLALGADPFTSDKSTLQKAYQLLVNQKPHVLTYEYGDSYAKRELQNSEISLTLGYAGDTYALINYTGKDDWQYVVPKEGTLIWVECFAFPKDRTISPAAIQFMQYLQQPEVAIKNAESIWLATPNESAISLASEEYRQDESLFPPKEALAKSYLYSNIAPEGQVMRHKIFMHMEQE